jgi:hypothetical protein
MMTLIQRCGMDEQNRAYGRRMRNYMCDYYYCSCEQ